VVVVGAGGAVVVLLVFVVLVLFAMLYAIGPNSPQQPRNQPTPRRTKFGDGTFLAGVGVVLGVVLGVEPRKWRAPRPWRAPAVPRRGTF
jgi:hypothetical protein